MADEPITCGIDLGTTNSLVAYMSSTGKPTSIPNFTGDILTPSMVYLEGKQAIVGSQARKVGISSPANFAECFKRYMGEDFFPKKVDGRAVRPEFLSALVLRRLKKEAQRQVQEVQSCVITVPAYFDEGRRRATRNAGVIAGWDVVDLINEPTAAAIAYAHSQEEKGQHPSGKERLLVYDLGGGTFDTTVLEVTRGREYRTLSTDGEVQLGGHDWDDWLANHFADQFKAKAGIDARQSDKGMLHFVDLARSAKHQLSARKSVSLPCVFQGGRALLEIDQQGFEQGTSHLLLRSKQTTEMALEQAKLKWTDIDLILLVGGSTRMPMVSRMLQQLTGKTPQHLVSPDEAVAHGAAVYARLLKTPNGPKVINVNSHSYRVLCINKQGRSVAHPLIPKNSPLPYKGAITVPTARAGIQDVFVKVCEGEADDPEFCMHIGRVHVSELPRDPDKRWRVQVILRCVEDGKLTASAKVHEPTEPFALVKEAQANLETLHGMTEIQVREARRELEALEMD